MIRNIIEFDKEYYYDKDWISMLVHFDLSLRDLHCPPHYSFIEKTSSAVKRIALKKKREAVDCEDQ